MEGLSDMFSYRGRDVVDRAGGTLGRLQEIYVDAASKRPHWARVELDVAGGKETLVPLSGAAPIEEGLQIPFERDTVIDAPLGDSSALHAYYEQALQRVELAEGAEPFGPPPDWP